MTCSWNSCCLTMEMFGLLSFLLLVFSVFGQPFVATDKNDLKILSSPANQLSWVGLYRSFAVWHWVDETLSNYFNFGKCASLNRAGYWYTTTCDNKIFFVCKKVSGDWVLVRENKTWQEAQKHCGTHHVVLAIMSNEEDNNIIRVLIETGFAWIGLASYSSTRYSFERDMEIGWCEQACHILQVV